MVATFRRRQSGRGRTEDRTCWRLIVRPVRSRWIDGSERRVGAAVRRRHQVGTSAGARRSSAGSGSSGRCCETLCGAVQLRDCARGARVPHDGLVPRATPGLLRPGVAAARTGPPLRPAVRSAAAAIPGQLQPAGSTVTWRAARLCVHPQLIYTEQGSSRERCLETAAPVRSTTSK